MDFNKYSQDDNLIVETFASGAAARNAVDLTPNTAHTFFITDSPIIVDTSNAAMSNTINKFVCCFKEAEEGEDSGGRGIRCFQRPKKRRRNGLDEEEMSVLDCVSKLAYEVTMNSTQNKS